MPQRQDNLFDTATPSKAISSNLIKYFFEVIGPEGACVLEEPFEVSDLHEAHIYATRLVRQLHVHGFSGGPWKVRVRDPSGCAKLVVLDGAQATMHDPGEEDVDDSS